MHQVRHIWTFLRDLWRQAPWPLGLFFLATALFLVFGRIAEEVIEGDADAFDRAISLLFRDPSTPGQIAGPPWLQEAMRDITGLGSTVVLVLILLVVIGYLVSARRYSMAGFLFAAVGSGQVISSVLKHLIGRTRPELLDGSPYIYSASFPSGHAMLSAITYLTLGALLTRIVHRTTLRAYLLTVAMSLTVLVGISRVYLGVHWPTDVLAGWCIGAAWAILCWAAALWFEIGQPAAGNDDKK